MIPPQAVRRGSQDISVTNSQASPLSLEEEITPDSLIEGHEVMATLSVQVDLPLKFYGQIMAYIRAVDFEVSGLGSASYKNGVFKVNEIHFVKQIGSGGHTSLDPTAIAELMGKRIKKGIRTPINVWWHSHVNFGTFWSGTDVTTAETLAKDKPFLLSFVGVQKGDLRCRVDIGHPIPVSFDTVPITVTGYTNQKVLVTKRQIQIAQIEIKKKVEEETFEPIIMGPLVAPQQYDYSYPKYYGEEFTGP